MRKLIILTGLSTLLSGLFAQDPQFSQFYAAPLYLGPSMAGVDEAPRLIANYRDQWPKLPGRFITYALSFDNFFEQYRSGLGLMALQDRAGGNKMVTTQIGINYSYRIAVSRNYSIQPGLAFNYVKRNINYNSMLFADQYFGNTVLPTSIENLPQNERGHFDYSASVLVFGKSSWIGFTVDHMMKLNRTLRENDLYSPIKISSYGGYKIVLKEKLMNAKERSISLAYQFRQQTGMAQLDLGAYYKQSPYMVGVWYRGVPIIKSTKSRDAITLMGGIEYNKFVFSYSYDFTISSLVTSTGGANEIVIVYRFERQKFFQKKHLGSVPCPKF